MGMPPGLEGWLAADQQRNAGTTNALNTMNALSQNQLSQMQYQTAARASADDQMLRSVLSDPSIAGDTTKAANALMSKGLYKPAMEMRKSALEAEKTRTGISKDQAEIDIKHLGIVGGGLAPLRNKPDLTPDDIVGALQGMVAAGVPQERVASIAKTIPQNSMMLRPWLDSTVAKTEHGLKTLEAYMPKVSLHDTGGNVQSFNTNSLAGGLGLMPSVPAVPKTATPGDLLTDTRGRASLTEQQRHNRNTESNAAQTLAQAKTQIVTDASGNITLVDKNTAVGRPVMDSTGAPMQGKAGNLNEHQGKATAFAMRMADSNKVISSLEGPGSKFDPSAVSSQLAGGTGLSAPLNYLASDTAQKYEQAKRNWVTANLRLESGAAIPDSELAQEYRKWFPIPGDGPAVIKQKMDSRKVAEQAMRVQAGPGAKQIPGGGASGGWTVREIP